MMLQIRHRRSRLFALIPLAILIAAACETGGAGRAAPDEVARNDAQWPLPNKDYANTRATTESSIDSSNVNQLQVAWTFDIPGSGPYGAAASNPIVADDVVYFQDLASNVFALDLQNGNVRWEDRNNAPVVGPNGPAIGYGKLFAATSVDTFSALNLANGEEVWSVSLDGPLGAHQPSVWDGRIYVATQAGAVSQEAGPGELAVRGYAGGTSGYIYGLNEQNGDQIWRFQTVAEDFWGNPDVNSGGGVWYPPAIDTGSGVTFWGTGNPAPFPGTVEFPNATSRPGPNLYTNSIVALDGDDGELRWYNQVKPWDLFDLDFQAPRILTSASVGGERRNIVIGAGKLGRVIAFERGSGRIVWDTAVGRHYNDDVQWIPPGEEILVFPGVLGGVETPMALADNTVYVPVVDLPTPYTADAHGAENGTEAVINAERMTNIEEGRGQMIALDVDTGEPRWNTNFDSVMFAGATVVNDLVFTATFDGMIYALRRSDGEIVWQFQAPAGINSWPAVAGDTIIWPAGVGENPQVIALRLGAQGVPTPTPTSESPSPTPTPTPASPTPTPGSPTPSPGAAQVELDLTAQNIEFDQQTLRAPAGADVSLTLTNEDSVPHNFALYRSEQAQEEIFIGEIFSGPNQSRTYEFQAPSDAGTYFFRCDVHPVEMTGDFVVE